jgi:hypothetical protein
MREEEQVLTTCSDINNLSVLKYLSRSTHVVESSSTPPFVYGDGSVLRNIMR